MRFHYMGCPMTQRNVRKVAKPDKKYFDRDLTNRKHQPISWFLLLLPFLVGLTSPALAEVVKKDFIVIYWNKIGFTDHSVTLNKTHYPAGTKLPVLRYGTSNSGERIVVIQAKGGDPEAYPLKYFTGAYESGGYIVTAHWDTTRNRITGSDVEDERVARAYHRMILLLHAHRNAFLGIFSIMVFLLLLLKVAGLRGGSWGFALLGYAFLFLGAIQGGLYADYLRAYNSLDWFALTATLPRKTGYDILNILFIPIMLGFLISIPITCIHAFSKGISKALPSSVDSYSSSGGYSSGVATYSDTKKVNPLLEAKQIHKAMLSDDKILRDASGKKVGTLEKAIFSNDQIIRDSSGRKVGRIEQSAWDRDKQILKGADGEKEGEIKTDFWGNRIIVDSDGKKVGKIKKNLWGETVIKKE